MYFMSCILHGRDEVLIEAYESIFRGFLGSRNLYTLTKGDVDFLLLMESWT